jgi:long-chain acyl-CoA synthetase
MGETATLTRPWLRFYDPGVPHTQSYPQITIPTLLEEATAQFGDRPATVFFGGEMTYRQLHSLVHRFASGLTRLGIRPGDRVSLHLPNSPQFLIAYYGALTAGAIVVPFNPLYAEREIEGQLVDSGVEVAVTLDLLYPRLASVRPKTSVREVVVTPINAYFPPLLRWLYPLKAYREGRVVRIPRTPGVHTFSSLLDAAPLQTSVPLDPGQTAVLLYTGGTTGVPKGAVLSHRNVVCNVYQLRAWFTRLRPGQDVVLAIVPFFHSYGMTTVMNFVVAAGLKAVLLPRFQIDTLLQAAAKYRPQVLPGVPTIYTAIVSHPQVSRYDLRSITACVSGAAPLPLDVQARFETLTGGRLREGYGLTEASPVTHANPLDSTLRKAGSIGIPIPDTDARIVDESGEYTLPPGEVGELVVRGPQVMQGYWHQPTKTAQTLRGGWLFTGDMAKMDEEGFFYIVDRKKDMIITGGLKVYPREVEEVLYAHPAVLEAAAIGIRNAYKGEMVKAFVVLREGQHATAEDIIGYCKSHLAIYKVPHEVEFRSQLPKSMVGKVLRRVLGEETPPAPR